MKTRNFKRLRGIDNPVETKPAKDSVYSQSPNNFYFKNIF